jgi:hypothetical protein
MIPDHRERHIIMTSMKCLLYLCDIEIKLYLTYKNSIIGKEKGKGKSPGEIMKKKAKCSFWSKYLCLLVHS